MDICESYSWRKPKYCPSSQLLPHNPGPLSEQFWHILVLCWFEWRSSWPCHRSRSQPGTCRSAREASWWEVMDIRYLLAWVSRGKLSNLIGQIKLIWVACEYMISLFLVIHKPACLDSTSTTWKRSCLSVC